jgi:hypothetical protein
MITKQQFWDLVSGHEFVSRPYHYTFIGIISGSLHQLSKKYANDETWFLDIVFDANNDQIIEATVTDFKRNTHYRLKHEKHPCYKEDNACKFVDLETDEDFLEKAAAIINGEEYDTRVLIPIDFTQEELLKYMTLAHEQDITFNQWIENAIRAALDSKILSKEPNE